MGASYLDYLDAAGNALQVPHSRPAMYMDFPYGGNQLVSDLEGIYYPRASDQMGSFQQGQRNVGDDIADAQAKGQQAAIDDAGLNVPDDKVISLQQRFVEAATGTTGKEITSGIVTGGLIAFGLLFLLVGIVLLVVSSDTGKAAIKTTVKAAA